MRLFNAVHRSYTFARRTWLFSRYHTVSMLLLIAAFPFFFAHYSSDIYRWSFVAAYFWFADWTKRKDPAAPPADAPTAIA